VVESLARAAGRVAGRISPHANTKVPRFARDDNQFYIDILGSQRQLRPEVRGIFSWVGYVS
jgi:hypothetical protein